MASNRLGRSGARQQDRNRTLIVAALVLLVPATIAVVNWWQDREPSRPEVSVPTTAPAEADRGPQVYIAMGDSYALSYQTADGEQHGFPDLVAAGLQDRDLDITLANFACGGATIEGMLTHPGCAFPPRPDVAVPYPDESQVAAVERYAAEHPGEVALISISIGGNDVIVCSHAANPISCAVQVIVALQPGLTEVLDRLRAAVGPNVPIVGTSYPNTMLGQWVHEPVNIEAAALSTRILAEAFNPQLKAAYEDSGAVFVDVTEASGGYGPLTTMVDTVQYGQIPQAVLTVCRLTLSCDQGDVHPTDEGQAFIADLVLDAVPGLRGD